MYCSIKKFFLVNKSVTKHNNKPKYPERAIEHIVKYKNKNRKLLTFCL